jgi:hypothetical protein
MPRCSLCYDYPFKGDHCPLCGYPASLNPPILLGEETQEIIRRPRIPLERWRAIGVPEDTIQAMINQRYQILQKRQVERWITVPNFAYPMPQLPEVQAEPKVNAMALDTDGYINPKARHWTEGKAYQIPMVEFFSTDYQLVEYIANMWNIYVGVYLYRRRTLVYRASTRTSRAVRICHLTKPHLIKQKTRAQEVLNTYKNTPMIPIT